MYVSLVMSGYSVTINWHNSLLKSHSLNSIVAAAWWISGSYFSPSDMTTQGQPYIPSVDLSEDSLVRSP